MESIVLEFTFEVKKKTKKGKIKFRSLQAFFLKPTLVKF